MDDRHLLDGTRKTPAKLSSLWHRIATMRERAFGRRMLAFSIACTTQSAQRSPRTKHVHLRRHQG